VTPPVTPVPEPNLPEPNQTADLTPAAATPHAGDGAGAGNRAPRTATTPPPDSGPPDPPGRHRQSADTKGLSRPPLCLLVGSTNSRPIRRSRPAQGRRTTGSSPRDPPRLLSLRLPRRKSSDHRLAQKPGPSSRPVTPAAATVPAATVTPVPEPNLPGPNQIADPAASRRPPSHHQDRDRGAGMAPVPGRPGRRSRRWCRRRDREPGTATTPPPDSAPPEPPGRHRQER
jgi:hypothetical protein